MDPTQQYTDGSYLQKHPDWDEADTAWKAQQIVTIIRRNGLTPRSIIDVGCGAGGIVAELCRELGQAIRFVGYDVSPQAIELAQKHASPQCAFHLGDVLTDITERFDLLLAIDVFEHVSYL